MGALQGFDGCQGLPEREWALDFAAALGRMKGQVRFPEAVVQAFADAPDGPAVCDGLAQMAAFSMLTMHRYGPRAIPVWAEDLGWDEEACRLALATLVANDCLREDYLQEVLACEDDRQDSLVREACEMLSV